VIDGGWLTAQQQKADACYVFPAGRENGADVEVVDYGSSITSDVSEKRATSSPASLEVPWRTPTMIDWVSWAGSGTTVELLIHKSELMKGVTRAKCVKMAMLVVVGLAQIGTLKG
jgi:hypothetical protein